MADHPATPILPPVRTVPNLNGTGAPKVAAFLTIPTLLLPIVVRDGNGTLRATNVVQYQPLPLRQNLNLLAALAPATTTSVGGSGLRSLTPTTFDPNDMTARTRWSKIADILFFP